MLNLISVSTVSSWSKLKHYRTTVKQIIYKFNKDAFTCTCVHGSKVLFRDTVKDKPSCLDVLFMSRQLNCQ